MKYLFIFIFSVNLFCQPLDENFHQQRRKVMVLKDYLESIQSRYWSLVIKLSGSDPEFRDILSKYNFILLIQQKYSSLCNKKVDFKCENIFFELMDSLNSLYEGLVKLKNRNTNLEYETLGTILRVQMFFVEYEVKKTKMSVHERYKLIEELKTYVQIFFNELNQNFSESLRVPSEDFWKNFIIQSHFLLADDSHLEFFVKNFNLMSTSFYNFVYALQNTDKIEAKIEFEAQTMNSQWNFIQKNLYKHEKK